ncbi:MAG: hypothetical protein KBD47_03625 [Candidatus Pacebacteria bacterium]|nr:hypothetical protein [Candidatus Paceibacterota bacterium]
MNAMEICKPNAWNIVAALVGIFSGILIATSFPFDSEEMPDFLGLEFGVFSAFVLFPLLLITHMRIWRAILWIVSWIVLSGISWFAAFHTFLFISEEFDGSDFPAPVVLMLVLTLASTVGITILYLAVASVIHTARTQTYVILTSVGALVSVISYYLAGEGFNGFLLDGNLDLIHPLWQCAVLYVVVSALYLRNIRPVNPSTI